MAQVQVRVGNEEAEQCARVPNHKSDPLEDVVSLVELYHQTGGAVPLDVKVAEVSALQQAATRLQDMAGHCTGQLLDLKSRQKLDLSFYRKKFLAGAIRDLTARRDTAAAAASSLISRYDELRNSSIERFVPMLMMTVEKYDQVFNAHLTEEAELSLDRLAKLCATVRGKGRKLRQPLPSAKGPSDVDTLMQLLSWAIQAQARLGALVSNATQGVEGCEIVMPPHPVRSAGACLRARARGLSPATMALSSCDAIVHSQRIMPSSSPRTRAPPTHPPQVKGVKRCLQKVQEEYEARVRRGSGCDTAALPHSSVHSMPRVTTPGSSIWRGSASS